MFRIFSGGIFFPDFTKDIHYISWTPHDNDGYSIFCWSYAVALRTLKTSEAKLLKLFKDIDNSSTQTFYPKAKITIMPNCRDYDNDEVYYHFNRALWYQDKRIRAKNVIFDMRNYTYHFPDSGIQSDREYIYMIKSAYERRNDNSNYYVLVRDVDKALHCFTYRYRLIEDECIGRSDELIPLSLEE